MSVIFGTKHKEGGLGEFIRLVLIVFLGGVCGILLRFDLLIRGMGIAALGSRVSNTNQES